MTAPAISFSGLASGIDSSALIKSLISRERTTRVQPLQDKITQLQDQSSSYKELSSLLGELNLAAGKFREVNGTALAKTVTSSNETVAVASADNSATNGSYNINVSQLARNATISLNDRYSSGTSAINSSINNGATAASRTVSLTVGTGSDQEAVDIELTSTTTASDFVNAFNDASNQAEASLINVGTNSAPSYAIVISSLNQGSAEGELAISVGSEVQTAGSGAFTANTLNQAQNSIFTLSGIGGTITRSKNVVNDVVNGLSFSLNSTGSATLAVTDNTEQTKQNLQDFVDAYNKVVSYISENDLVSSQQEGSETLNTFGPLANSSLDENILATLRSALSGSRNSSSTSTVKVLADLGITTERDGTLKFDNNTFQTALETDPESARTITSNLGETLASVGGTIAQFTRFGGLIDSAVNSNNQEISRNQSRISDVEKNLSNQEQSLTARYARLEGLIGQLNSQQSALGSLLK